MALIKKPMKSWKRGVSEVAPGGDKPMNRDQSVEIGDRREEGKQDGRHKTRVKYNAAKMYPSGK